MPIKSIKAADIEDALALSTRQYLVGNLAKPQQLANLNDDDLEVGISSYAQSDFEAAHRHAKAKEYQLVLKGMTEYIDIDTKTKYTFGVGDFFVIYPGTSYIQRIKSDTRILFFKYPAGNDKELVAVPAELETWAREPLRVKRLDLRADAGAPEANSLKPAVAVAVLNESDQLLLVKRRDSGYWSMPGGTMELSDSIQSCGMREVHEETGLEVMVTGIIGTYSDPKNIVAYTDGEVRREFSILLAATPLTDSLSRDDESTDIAWVTLDDIDAYPVVPSQGLRIADVIKFRRDRFISLR